MGAVEFIEWAATALTVALIATFILYLVSLALLPHVRRPPVAQRDRFGRALGAAENRDAHLDDSKR